MRTLALLTLPCLVLATAACGDDDGAIDRRIGAECTVPADCDDGDDQTLPLECLTEFAGGYCGETDCVDSTDCPDGSVCVTYEGANYCFLTCVDKPDCNPHRSVDNESNCSSNVSAVDSSSKVCVPPSSGNPTDFAPEDLDGMQLVLAETGGPTNTWTFAADASTTGMATLEGTGDFPFTFVKNDVNDTTLTFDVSGDDVYQMTWTSAAGGTFEESFEGAPGNPGTFTVSPAP